jgi:hypothetical protein
LELAASSLAVVKNSKSSPAVVESNLAAAESDLAVTESSPAALKSSSPTTESCCSTTDFVTGKVIGGKGSEWILEVCRNRPLRPGGGDGRKCMMKKVKKHIFNFLTGFKRSKSDIKDRIC